jgi:predicted TIM-barrel fold metal-dependent hydrolase
VFAANDQRFILELEGCMRIVDAHHHLWDIGRIYYPWLSDQAPLLKEVQ